MNPSSQALPAHARVIADASVWMESAGVDQLGRVARLPGCCRAVGMPDLHPGRGLPIGAVFAFRDRILPALIGGDAGCGVRMVVVKKVRARGDALLRRVDAATDGPALPDADPLALAVAAWRYGPRGLAEVPGVPASLAALAAAEPEEEGESGPLCVEPRHGQQLGTAGGGNHFLELSRVGAVTDAAAGRALGLRPGAWVVLAHSGSRGLGGALATRWREPLDTPEAQAAWLADLRGACRYARANRLVLTWRMRTALGAAGPARASAVVDLVHNTVVEAEVDGARCWLHRKGAAPAAAEQITVVLGSRGAPSWVMRGAGRADCLWSVAHGAGRRMGRAEAIGKLGGKHRRRDLDRDGHVLCDDRRLLLAEHPDAYKAIAPVVRSLEAAGAATGVASLIPHITVKR